MVFCIGPSSTNLSFLLQKQSRNTDRRTERKFIICDFIFVVVKFEQGFITAEVVSCVLLPAT
jgi:hypothetical protein